MMGNMTEWVQDEFIPYMYSPVDGSAYCETESCDENTHMMGGGSYLGGSSYQATVGDEVELI